MKHGEMKYSKADNSIFKFTATEFIFCGCFVGALAPINPRFNRGVDKKTLVNGRENLL